MCGAAAVGNSNGIRRYGGEGGPTIAIDKQEPESLRTLDWGQVVSRVDVAGSPWRQLASDEVVVESWRGRPDAMVLLPPFMRKAVALSWWPSALCKHVRDVCLL